MSVFAIAVAVRIVANPVSNALQKGLAVRNLAPMWIIWLTHLGLSIVCLPWAAVMFADLGGVFWWNMTTAALLAVVCNTLLVEAVKRDDLSLLGPINSLKPVVSLVPAFLLLGEIPRMLSLVGIGLVVVGSYFLVGGAGSAQTNAPRVPIWRRRGVQLRAAALVVSGIEAVFLKRALAEASPTTTFVAWSIVGLAFASLLVGLRRGGLSARAGIAAARRHAELLSATVAATGLMQYSTLVAFVDAPVASVLALFQLSSLVSVLLGHRLFGEPHVVRRLIASAVMAVGAALITLDC